MMTQNSPDETIYSNKADYRALFQKMDEGYCIIQLLYNENGLVNNWLFLDVNPAFERHNGLVDATGKTVCELVPDIEHKWMNIYNRVVQTGESIRIVENSIALGRYFDLYAFRVGNPEESKIAVLFTDITERKNLEERQSFLNELSDTLRPLAEPTAIHDRATHLAMQYFGADRCYYCEIVNGDAIIGTDAMAEGLQSVAGTYPLKEFSLFLAVVNGRKTFVVNNVHDAENVDPALKRLCIQLQIISFIDVPVIKDDVVIGLLCLVQGHAREWRQIDMSLAEEIAERVWVAVERAKADMVLREKETADKLRTVKAEQQQEIIRVTLNSVEEERHRIAESLHNGLGQLLYGAKISLAGLHQHQTEADFQKVKNQTNQMLTEAIRESRRISHDLMPTTLEEFGLRAAVLDICEQLGVTVRFKCKILITGKRLEKYVELAVYRTVQELMTNIVKHARADNAGITILIDEHNIHVRVDDNGIGFEPDKKEKPGIGLAAIRSKVKLLNGEVTIQSQQNKGSIIDITIPRTDA